MQVKELRSSFMGTIAIAGNSVRAMREWKKSVPTEHLCGVSVLASVNADRDRIYRALTVPEYMDAWFSIPGAIPGRTGILAGDDCFSITYWSATNEECRVYCSYQVRRRSKLVFTWRQFTLEEATSSMVKIRLLGDFSRTTVHVTHVGLMLSDQQWYENLWESSLLKLGKLF